MKTPRLFNRVIEFIVEGEIYDKNASAESILNNYNWSFDDNIDGNVQLFAHHKDTRGRITQLTRSSKIRKCRKPDKSLFLG